MTYNALAAGALKMELCPIPYFIFTIAVKTKQKGLAGNKTSLAKGQNN